MKLLSLDLSTSCSGWAIFENNNLIEFGKIEEGVYKGKSKEKYPQRTGRVGKIMAENLCQLMRDKKPDKIVIEEASSNGIAGVKSIKSLIMLHGSLLTLMLQSDFYQYDTLSFLSPREWRGAVGLKKNGDFKQSSIQLANEKFSLQLEKDSHDISDAILLGYGYLKFEGKL